MFDIDEAALKVAAEKVKSEFGQPVLAMHCNIVDKASVDAAAQAIKAANMPPVGAVANVAGIPSPSSFLELSLEEWNRVYAVNCTGSFLVCQAFIPQMIAGGYGRIINMSSVTAQHGGGVFSKTSYAAAKAGVIGLTRGLAREFAHYGITANAICPGVVDTDIRVGSTPENEVKLAEAVPMKRQCKPEEIAALYVWLSSADAGYITGTTQNINGGAYIA